MPPRAPTCPSVLFPGTWQITRDFTRACAVRKLRLGLRWLWGDQGAAEATRYKDSVVP
jgi:hypothetical protein